MTLPNTIRLACRLMGLSEDEAENAVRCAPHKSARGTAHALECYRAIIRSYRLT